MSILLGSSQRDRDLEAIVRAEDARDAKRDAKRAEHKRQKSEALVYVKDYVFAYCPIVIESVKRNGELHELITLSNISEEEKRTHKLIGFPDSAVVEADGTIVVRWKGGTKKVTISPKTLRASKSSPPPVPREVLLIIATSSSIAIAWEKALGCIVTRYEVQYRLQHRMSVWKALYVGRKSTAKLINVLHAKTFEFRVRAEGPAGWSRWSPTSSFRSLSLPPDPPREPVAGTRTWQSVEILWTPPINNGDDIVSYTVQCRRFRVDVSSPARSGIDTWRTFSDIPFDQTVLVIDRLLPSTDFEIRVRAHTKAGAGMWSPSAIVTTPARSANADLVLLRETESWQEHYNLASGNIVYLNPRTSMSFDAPPHGFVSELESMDEEARRCDEERRAKHIESLFRTKRFRFVLALRDRAKRKRGQPSWTLLIRRAHVFEDALTLFADSSAQSMMMRRMNVRYVGEDGVDAGGLTKDLFAELSNQLLHSDRGLFRQVKEGGETRYTFSRASRAECGSGDKEATLRKRSWRFAGTLMGKALMERSLMNLPLTSMVWHHFAQQSTTSLEDLRRIDPELCRSLDWMRKNSVEGVLFETFSVRLESSDGAIIVPLIPHGERTDVTDKNKDEYIKLLVRWHTKGKIEIALNEMMSGFSSVVPPHLVRVFNPEELSELVNGESLVDTAALRRTCAYSGGINDDSVLATWFWLLVESMNPDERSLLLLFVTGSSKMPLDGFDPPFNIELNNHADARTLPVAHTCFNQLVLPPYDDFDVMSRKVFQAIEETQGGGFHLE